ncbi:MAG: dephospho-CoA kinase [Candidatus Ancaeobacter aquaticus]|nr:dephospho-CoA kinase [Candidatus Ancaeobacter aquaticus]
MKNKAVIIGLTGGYGAGKSTVSAIMQECGWCIIDADEIARNALIPKTKVYNQIVDHFGVAILANEKTIDRKKLAEIVFNDKRQLEYLNAVVHPIVIRKIKKIIKENLNERNRLPVVISAPLLCEAGMQNMCDFIVVIKIKKEVQVKRCRTSKGESVTGIRKRMAMQMPLAEKLQYADFVIDNNGSKKHTRSQVCALTEEVQCRIYRNKNN